MFDITVNWKESLLILLGLIIIVLLFYVFNRKSIARESEAKRLLKERFERAQTEPAHVISSRKATPKITQAYERLIILMERIDLQKLVVRVTPISQLKQDYTTFLLQNIDQEFDFNISQQLYVSEEAWALIATAKQTIIQQVLKTSLREDIKNAQELQQELIKIKHTGSVVDLAKNRLKQEFNSLV
ncbi:MAG TPA: hypothetical protein VLY87_06115 [Flavobacterium sp.]|nr:hypothetical protein [Flavobacterium sp.]